jgi:aryl-alcohol dehydrogenase-like predicted oxidoreductase
MKAAYDAGINFFDTAEGYEGGASEVIMGKCIKHYGWKQQDLVITTKVGYDPFPVALRWMGGMY